MFSLSYHVIILLGYIVLKLFMLYFTQFITWYLTLSAI